jgi:hypothetical protein
LDEKPSVIFRRMPKRIRLHLPVPRGYFGDLSVNVVNDDFDGSDVPIVSLCSLKVVESATNIPCVHPFTDTVEGVSEDSKIVDG